MDKNQQNPLSNLAGSKKAVVFLLTTALLALATFGGFEPAAVEKFVDSLYVLAVAYLGGQSIADLGKYAGDAIARGREVVESKGKSETSAGDAQASAEAVAGRVLK